jgi:hypothetical protein
MVNLPSGINRRLRPLGKGRGITLPRGVAFREKSVVIKLPGARV